MNFIKFTEVNDHEGETWYSWLQVDGNEEELSKLRALLELLGSEEYTLGYKQWGEEYIDFAVEEGGWGYMNTHTKVAGRFVCPDIGDEQEPETIQEFCDEEFYKGGVENHFN